MGQLAKDAMNDVLYTGMHPEINARGDCGRRSGNHPGERPERSGPPELKPVVRAWKVELKPNKKQERKLYRFCGARRFVWNKGLERIRDEYEAWKSLPEDEREPHRRMSAYDLGKWFVELKREPETAWLRTVPATVIEHACGDLDLAFKAFFRRIKHGEKPGYPKFRSRDYDVPTFRVRKTKTNERHVFIPLIGPIRVKEKGYLPALVRSAVKTVTVKRHGGKWWATVVAEWEVEPLPEGRGEYRIDTRGEAIACQNGVASFTISKPHVLRSELRRLKRIQRRVSRRQKGSKRHGKAVVALQKCHARIARKRLEHLRRATTDLIRKGDTFEVIRVKELIEKGEGLAQADSAVGEFIRQLEYKTDWYGGTCDVSVAE